MTTTTTAENCIEIIDSPVVVGTNPREAFGVLYENGRDTATCAKMIREDVARAQKHGVFEGLKVSVTMKRFSGGSSVSVKITAATCEVMRAPFATKNELGVFEERSRRYTPRIERALRWLEIIVDQYRRDDSDAMSDYYDVNFYRDVSVGIDLDIASREKHVRAGHGRMFRLTLDAINAAGGVTDDRVELAVSAFERGDITRAVMDVEALKSGGPTGSLARAIHYAAEAWASDRDTPKTERVVALLAPALELSDPKFVEGAAATSNLHNAFIAQETSA